MHSAPRYFVRIGDEVRGPYEPHHLQQLAEVDVVTPATPVSLSPSGNWTTIAAVAELGAIFRVRPEIGFKPTNFEVVNQDGVPPVDLRATVVHGSRLALPGAKEQSIPRLTATERGARHDEANEVREMVGEVLRFEAAIAPPPPPPKRRPLSRRFKLCAALALLGNAVLVAIPLGYGGWDDLWSMMILKGWAILYNGGLVVVYFGLPRE